LLATLERGKAGKVCSKRQFLDCEPVLVPDTIILTPSSDALNPHHFS
jgi:hypothetical protein